MNKINNEKRLELIKDILKVMLFNPKLLITSKYDTPIENYKFQRIIKLYLNNEIIEEKLNTILKKNNFKVNLDINCAYLNKYRNGSITNIEIDVLNTICKTLNPERILEIGTFEGRGTLNMAKNTPSNTKITTICLPQKVCNFEIGKHYKETAWNNKIIQIYGDTSKINMEELGKFDLIFVDGSHEYKYVLKDSINALKMINEKGIIVYHDVDLNHLGCTSAIYESTQEANVKLQRISGTNMGICVMK